MDQWKRIFLVSMFALLLFTTGKGQELVQPHPLQTDSLQLASTDTFDYVYPPADRPHQLLEQLLSNNMRQSIDPVAALAHLRQHAQTEDAILQQAGNQKHQRPVWVLALVFVLFLAIGLIRLAFPADFSMIVQAYFDERSLQQMSKEDNMLTSWSYVFLYLIFSFALALFIVVVESSFENYQLLNAENYLKTAFFVALLFIAKILFIRFISLVFEIGRLVREYVTVLYLVYFNSMLFLMPFLLTVTLVSAVYFKILLILFSVLVSILFIYRFLRTAIRLFGNLKFSIFYLILYLCALEVAPILILVRTLSN